MAAFVVDTNVLQGANGIHGDSHADPACVIACIDALLSARDGVIVLDEAMLILKEYMRNVRMGGEPGAGDAFMKWIWSVQADVRRCERVALTPRPGTADDFLEFPDDPALFNFDRSDRKFVAVAIASERTPVVLNALDTDWATSHEALIRNGLTINFLCPQHVHPANDGAT